MVRDALILALAPRGTNGRINRLIQSLQRDNWKVSELGPRRESGAVELSARRFFTRVLLYILISAKVEPARAGYLAASTFLFDRSRTDAIKKFDGVIIVEDILLLPLILHARPSTRIVVDVRDLSHRLLEHRAVWRRTIGWSIGRMMSTLLPATNAVYTVSQGLAEVLHSDFGVRCTVVRSIPDVEPRKIKTRGGEGRLKIVYAGRADQNRRIDLLLAACKGLGKSVALDLYLVGHRADIKRLEKTAKQMPNVQTRPPVPIEQLVDRLSEYDLGYAAWPPKTLNLAYALPNKFFEYLFAGTPVIVCALGEMAKIVDHFSCGVVVDPGDTSSFRRTLQDLASNSLSHLAPGVQQAQEELSWTKERQRLLRAISG